MTANSDEVRRCWLAGDRAQILDMLDFLLRNEEAVRKRAYLAPHLSPPADIPPEFAQTERTPWILYTGHVY